MSQNRYLWILGVLAVLSAVMLLGAQMVAQQQSGPQYPSQTAPQQTPSQPPQTAPTQPPDQTAPSSAAGPQTGGEQIFAGTIVKSGDKYVLQDSSGKSYDLDHQELLKEHEGKQVRIKGTLDPDGKTIHIGGSK